MNCSARKADIWVLPQGTLALVRPLTQRADEWITRHAQDHSQRFGPALVIEHHHLPGLLNGMIEDGLDVTQQFQN
jgi:hypothetical protein